MNNVKAAVVQTVTIAGDTSATIDKVIGLINDCANQGAQVEVFPEAFVGGYS